MIFRFGKKNQNTNINFIDKQILSLKCLIGLTKLTNLGQFKGICHGILNRRKLKILLRSISFQKSVIIGKVMKSFRIYPHLIKMIDESELQDDIMICEMLNRTGFIAGFIHNFLTVHRYHFKCLLAKKRF